MFAALHGTGRYQTKVPTALLFNADVASLPRCEMLKICRSGLVLRIPPPFYAPHLMVTENAVKPLRLADGIRFGDGKDFARAGNVAAS